MEVYNRYYKAMYNTSLRIVKHEAEAEDIMQESFLSAFTKLDSYKGEASFGSWLKRIVVNNSLNAYNKGKKLDETPLEDHLYKIEDDAEGVSEVDLTSVRAQEVVKAMSMLKDNYRQSLSLHLIEGYDYEEMSEIMNVSYANCRTMVSRAKDSLRKLLNNNEKGTYRSSI
ncbi:RNA polymerase sigma-70 factor (ECF subfamily) [Dokdonia sp. Hel_I_63]|uniref:RNA polymerase sigma factor n=1 Tax=unclassified Dokdonia TaxID=2615033 RepID=UPI00020A7A68|nr:RNA polymerase, sigma-24 subunit, ECF subfamily [Dokdonia sp. 4H-3-7-5]TVZ22511.1 RNA polymerase sigma-70 factor (ECF subfamily) [Dokdonia sp. Hel_I_63]